MLYDVFVVGAKDPSPVAQMHLSADLAKHFQAPVAEVAQAISTRNLRAGKSLDEAQARILCQQLANLGAITELRPTVQGARARVPTQTQARSQTTSEISVPTLPTLSTMPGTDVVGRDPFAAHTHAPQPATTVNGPYSSGTYAAATMPNATGIMGGPTLGAPPSLRMPGAAPPRPTSGARNPFSAPDEGAPRLELARATNSARTAVETVEIPKVRPGTLPGTSGLNHMRLGAADSAVSGVEVAGDSSKSHMLRCVKHGLYYDQRSSSGCRKCMEPAKQMARKIEHNALGFKLMALRDNPAKRASWGLGLALALGFLPAAWHALAFGRPEVQSLRAEQAVLSQKVGTEEIIRQYRSLDEHVHDVHSKHRRNTALIWVVMAGGALAGWYRLT